MAAMLQPLVETTARSSVTEPRDWVACGQTCQNYFLYHCWFLT